MVSRYVERLAIIQRREKAKKAAEGVSENFIDPSLPTWNCSTCSCMGISAELNICPASITKDVGGRLVQRKCKTQKRV